jgi:hypothetical protein
METIHFVSRAKENSLLPIHLFDFQVQNQSTGDTIRAFSAGLFHEQSKRSSLKGKSQSRDRGVGKVSLTLRELLVDISNMPSRTALARFRAAKILMLSSNILM